MSEILGILPVIGSCLEAALAEAPGEIGRGEGAVEVTVDGRLCDVGRDVEVGRVVWRERVLRDRLGREMLGRRARGGL